MTATFGRFTRTAATIAAAALFAGSMAPAMAATPDTDAAPAPAKVQPAQTQGKPEISKTRMICVKSYTTGSHIAQQTCKTRERWIKEDGVDPLDMQAR